MCTGLEPGVLLALAGGAASGAGAMYNADTQNNAIEGQNKANADAAAVATAARDQEAVRQVSLERQQAEEVSKALMEANPTDALMRAQQTVAAPENAVASSAGAYNAGPLPGDVKNENIDTATKGYEDKSKARGKSMIDALALLTAMSGGFARTNDTLQNSGSNIATIGGARRGSLDANRLEVGIPAPTYTPSDSITGDLLMLGGQAAAGFGGQALGKAGTSIGDIIMSVGRKKPPLAGPAVSMGGIY